MVGAHLSGQPLNGQLVERGGVLVGAVRTAPEYRLVALPVTPPKPGLVWVGADGCSIEAERWRLPMAGFGSFVAAVPAPLCIGTVLLEDGSATLGFLCESWAADASPDISVYGGWRAYLAAT